MGAPEHAEGTVDSRLHSQGTARVGCAGWSLPSAAQGRFPAAGSHLERYAARLDAVEINSSFHRPHSRSTYARWAEGVPERFRFAVKLPRAMTHERKLHGCEKLLDVFISQVEGLGDRLGCLLVQLPPSLSLDAPVAGDFLNGLRQRWSGPIAAEPRHASWFTAEAEAFLDRQRVARVLADPVRHPSGERPGGWTGAAYLRLHGTPRVYYSAYPQGLIESLAHRIGQSVREGRDVWCVFDNTASGAAADNALSLQQALDKELA